MTNRTHSIKLSVDSTYVTIKDLTTLDEYAPNVTDPIAQTTGIVIELTIDGGTTVTYAPDPPALIVSDLRDVNGLTLTPADFGMGDSTFSDDLWATTVNWTFTVDGLLPSTKQEFFYSDIENSVVKAVVNGDWKDTFNYRSKSSYSKAALRYKRWLDQLKLANNQGLINEGKALLNSLKSIF